MTNQIPRDFLHIRSLCYTVHCPGITDASFALPLNNSATHVCLDAKALPHGCTQLHSMTSVHCQQWNRKQLFIWDEYNKLQCSRVSQVQCSRVVCRGRCSFLRGGPRLWSESRTERYTEHCTLYRQTEIHFIGHFVHTFGKDRAKEQHFILHLKRVNIFRGTAFLK